MLDAMISTMSSNYVSFLEGNVVPKPMGTEFPTVVPYQVFQTKDRALALAVGSEKLWAAFCGAIGRPDLIQHPDYASNSARIRNREALDRILGGIFAGSPAAEWLEKLRAAGIPGSLVRNFREVVEHPQSAVREMFPEMPHPIAGKHRITGAPVKLSETPGRPKSPAPLLGQHTRAALGDVLGLDPGEIQALFAAGVVAGPEGF
jgi:crotonobetainyl-CoA:carnitine CoA-transferase CaiB-like acyl-CoA transferase